MPKPHLTPIHAEGPGLRLLGPTPYYGGGYCGICGGDSLIPVQVRYWDPDDGWRVGVLCFTCGEAAGRRGPREHDCAYRKSQTQAERISVLAELLGHDADGIAAMAEDLEFLDDEPSV